MKPMCRWLAAVLAVMMMLTLVACGEGEKSKGNAKPSGSAVNSDLDLQQLETWIAWAADLSSEDFSADTWAVLEDALRIARQTRRAKTQEAVDAALANLQKAVEALQSADGTPVELTPPTIATTAKTTSTEKKSTTGKMTTTSRDNASGTTTTTTTTTIRPTTTTTTTRSTTTTTTKPRTTTRHNSTTTTKSPTSPVTSESPTRTTDDWSGNPTSPTTEATTDDWWQPTATEPDTPTEPNTPVEPEITSAEPSVWSMRG